MLITIEGVSGAGKSTLVRSLTERLHAVIDLADQERVSADLAWQLGHLMRVVTVPFGLNEAVLLYAARTAGRARLAQEHLAAQPNSIAVADRFAWSLAVQLRRVGLDETTSQALLALATRGLPSALTILLDVSFTEHVRRVDERGHQPLAEPEFSTQRQEFHEEYDRCWWPRLLIDTTSLRTAEVEDMAAQQIGLLVAGRKVS